VATVTYVKPRVGSEPAGFFLQGEQFWEAIFVAVDPASLAPPPALGDRVSFDVTATANVDGMLRITGLTAWQIASRGHPVAPLVDPMLDPSVTTYPMYWESALVSLSGRVEAFSSLGNGFVAAPVETAAWGPASSVQLRIPEALQQSLDLSANCVVALTAGPFWLSGTTGYPTAYAAGDFATVTCPAPTLLRATATSSREVVLEFDRRLDPGTVQSDGSQFAISPALAVIAAAASGSQVTLTTATQGAGTGYTVSVAAAVADTHGTPLGLPSSAPFVGSP
jgi:hypothetical protein